jgi:tight adherence protein C
VAAFSSGVEPPVVIAICAALGVCLLAIGVLRWQRRRYMRDRLLALAEEWAEPSITEQPSSLGARDLAGRVGARLAQRMPGQVGLLDQRVDRAGLSGQMPTVELLGWKIVCTACGVIVGLAGTVRYGAPGLVMLVLGAAIGWFGIDLMLARYHAQRRRSILRDLPTVMDLLVLSLEAGMGLDRAMRTLIRDYRSALSEELRRVLNDVDLGISRAQAFERMALRVGLEDLRSLSRAIVQSEELGVSLVGVMQTQAHEVRLSRRRAAEAEALRAPIKMLIPLVVFILPTLFMLLVGPVALRAGEALSGSGVIP